ncbi:MAG: PAS domain S-box protein [Anaerolineales bacterium]|nr:PAS domain S-box protein [Anaerolineales bacterium]
MNQDKRNAGKEDWQTADARVLGQLLAAQNILFTLPDNQRIAEFFAQALVTLPGVSYCRVCLGDVSIQVGGIPDNVCLKCEELRKAIKETITFFPEIKCELSEKPNIYSHTIQSGEHHFGFFTIQASASNIFDVYWPFVGNLANYVALSLENRYHKDLLQKAHDQMEKKVVERTLALENANIHLQQEIELKQQTAEALRASEERYRTLVEQASDGIFVADAQGNYLDVNPTGCNMLGYTREEILKLNMRDLASMTSQAERPLQFDDLYAGKDLLSERLLVTKSGAFLPVEISGKALDNGHLLGIVRDITERKQAEQALKRLNRELRAISNCNQTLLRAEDEQALLDDICKIVCHEAGYVMAWVGYEEEDKRIRPVSWAGDEMGYLMNTEIFCDGTDQNPAGLALKSGQSVSIQDFFVVTNKIWGEQALQRGYRSCLALPLLNENKKTFGVFTIYATESNVFTPEEIQLLEELAGDLAFGITVLRARAERKQTDEQLRKSEHLFRALVENSPDFIARYDREYRRIYVNPAIQALFTIPAGETLGRTPTDRTPLYAPKVYIEHLQKTIETASESTLETPFRTAQGEMHWGQIRFVPEFDSDENVTSVLAIGRDIHEIKENERRFRMLAENFPDFVMRFVRDGRCTYANPAVEAALGNMVGQMLSEFLRYEDTDQKDVMSTQIQRVFDEGIPNQSERYWDTERGSRIFEIRNAPEKDAAGDVVSVLSIARDVTEQKRIEQEHLAHLRFLESLDMVNRVIQGTNYLEEMMRNVLDVILSIFDCDRAWLVYPCDPEVQKWQTPMERTRPEYPGVLPIGVELPLDPVGAEVFRILRAANRPVQFGIGGEHPVPEVMFQVFRVQSFIAMALYPKVGLPWSFGLHQCTYARIWTLEEERLLQEIGRRLADALTSLLAYQDLQESERKLGEAERMAHVGYWVRDYVTDLITLSDEACRIFGLPLERQKEYDLKRWHEQWQNLIYPEDRSRAAQAAQEALQGGPRYEVEYRVVRPNGEIRIVRSQGDVTWDETGQPRRMFGIMQDITELRLAEDELRASEARFRIFVNHAADAFYLHDAKGSILDVNRQACESLGYSREELVGMTPRDFDASIDPSLLDQMELRLDKGEVIAFDTKHRRKDGRVFPVELRVRPFWQGEHRFSVSLARDITERKQAQEALALFRSLIEHASDIIEIADPETGRFLDVNEQACRAHGYTREEYLALTVNQINPVAATRSWKETVDELQNFGSIVRESKHQRKDGSIFPVEINITYVRLDRDYILSVVRDITKRKKADEALRGSEERYRALYHENPSMFFSLDVKGTIISLNDFGASQLGYTINELEGKPVLEIFYEEDKLAVSEQLNACLHDPWKVYRWQFRKVRKDGSLMWVEEFARTVNGPDGTVYMLIVCQDISERKHVEQQIRKLNQELEERVTERTVQLEAANKELEAFAYSISHDLRAPLRHIGGFLELLRVSTETTLDEQSLHYLATISDASRRMGLMIDALLSFSRMSRSKMSEVEVDLEILVQEVLNDFELDFAGRDIQWHLTTLPKVIGDRTLLRMVFENLISNALKFTRSRVQTKIEIGWLYGPQDEIVIFVRDNGVGFDMDYADKLFGVFQRLHRTDEFEGTGIGLANVRRIIERHGGKTWAEAHPGVGATFYFSFPNPETII